jgi:NAD(P)-dependent dehydrogenase (short-subunit alcohol dehydrogenase family)
VDVPTGPRAYAASRTVITPIITGAASGIGKDIALRFSREGAKVAIAGLKKEAADATAEELRAGGGIAMGVVMDVSSEQAVNDGVVAVAGESGGVDVLVSNAGIQIVHPINKFPFGMCEPFRDSQNGVYRFALRKAGRAADHRRSGRPTAFGGVVRHLSSFLCHAFRIAHTQHEPWFRHDINRGGRESSRNSKCFSPGQKRIKTGKRVGRVSPVRLG